MARLKVIQASFLSNMPEILTSRPSGNLTESCTRSASLEPVDSVCNDALTHSMHCAKIKRLASCLYEQHTHIDILFLLPIPFHHTIKSRKHPTPNSKLSVRKRLISKPDFANRLIRRTFPPITGALALIAAKEPITRSPLGEFLAPLMPCHIVPPTAPIAKAPLDRRSDEPSF